MEKKMKIIINADDLGRNELINKEIFQLADKKLITSATLLANGDGFNEVIEKKHNYPNLSIGAHLNLTLGKPLSQNINLSPLLNTDGEFYDLNTLKKINFTTTLKTAIYTELSLQIEKIKEAGIEISHIDSHNHIHYIPKLFFIFKKIQKKYSIKKIRLARTLWSIHEEIGIQKKIRSFLFNFFIKNYYSSFTTSGFTNFLSFYEHAVDKQEILNYRSLEIMVHPGSKTSDYRIGLLKSEWQKKIKFPIEFINYNQL